MTGRLLAARQIAMQLVADRFVHVGHRTIDLASGLDVVLRHSPIGNSDAQMAWVARCDRRVRTSGAGRRRLVDFGLIGPGGRFEALARMDRRGVVAVDGVQPTFDALVELLESGRPGKPRRVFLNGCQAAVGTLWCSLAREARARGYIPVADAALDRLGLILGSQGTSRVLDLVAGRHLVVFVDQVRPAVTERRRRIDWYRAAWLARLLVTIGLRDARPHLVIRVGGALAELGHALTLSAVPPAPARPETRRPSTRPSSTRPAASDATRRAITPSTAEYPFVRSDGDLAVVAESGGVYNDEAPRGGWLPVLIGGEHESAELIRARRSVGQAVELASRGRHTPAERLFRQATAAFARRRANQQAGYSALTLARLLLQRGRLGEAVTVLQEAHGYFDAAEHASGTIRVALAMGLALTDEGRMAEGEAALRSARMAAEAINDADALRLADLALARCLYWQARFDEARLLVQPRLTESAEAADRSCPSDGAPSPAVLAQCLASRIALATADLSEAGARAAAALERAGHRNECLDVASARTALAMVHSVVGDLDAARMQVRQGLVAAHRGHAPLRGLRLRLTLLEALLRASARREASALARAIGRLAPRQVPQLLRRRMDLLLACSRDDPPLLARVRTHIQTFIETAGAAGFTSIVYGVGEAVHKGEVHVVEDLIELLQLCHESDDDVVLGRLTTHVRERLRAATAACYGAESSGLIHLALAGPPIRDRSVAERAVDAGIPIAPAHTGGGFAAAVPVRYASRTIGAFACRWSIEATFDRDRSIALLSTAAAVAAPLVRAALDRRVVPPTGPEGTAELIGVSQAVNDVRAAIVRAAGAPFPVLIEGESGSGKELVARAIYRRGPRRTAAFCALNCAALSDELVEAELFGHARGAFTGALAQRAGLFEEADGGVLFLDELGELSARAQAKLLRVLQDGEIRRVGENVARRVDVRVIAATNRSLPAEVGAGRFRQDLLYRLDVIRIVVPPLRQHLEDIPLLAGAFWAQATERIGSRATLAAATIAALARYDWPGNVRELQNVLAAIAVSAPRRGSIGPATLPPTLAQMAGRQESTLEQARRRFEERFVRAALARAGGHRGRAAADLGMSRQGLSKLLARLQLDEEGGRA